MASFVFQKSEARVADSSSPTSDRGPGRVMVVRKPTGALLMAYCFLALVTCGNFDRTLRTVLSVPLILSGDFLSFTRPAPERCCFPRRSRYSSSSLDPYRFATGRETNDVALPSPFRLRPQISTEQLTVSVSKDVGMVNTSSSVERCVGLFGCDPRLRMSSVQLSESPCLVHSVSKGSSRRSVGARHLRTTPPSVHRSMFIALGTKRQTLGLTYG